MTAKTSQHLADTLRAAGFEDLAVRAEADEFHDFLSPHAFPEMELDRELLLLMGQPDKPEQFDKAAAIRGRHHMGGFDASLEESDDWAASEDGQAVYNALKEGK